MYVYIYIEREREIHTQYIICNIIIVCVAEAGAANFESLPLAAAALYKVVRVPSPNLGIDL